MCSLDRIVLKSRETRLEGVEILVQKVEILGGKGAATESVGMNATAGTAGVDHEAVDEIFGREEGMKGGDSYEKGDGDGDEFGELGTRDGVRRREDAGTVDAFVGLGILGGGHGLESAHRGQGGGRGECKGDGLKEGGGGCISKRRRLDRGGGEGV